MELRPAVDTAGASDRFRVRYIFRANAGAAPPAVGRILIPGTPYVLLKRRSISCLVILIIVGLPWGQCAACGVFSISLMRPSISRGESSLPARTDPWQATALII
jgi:hypothetical protein